MREFTDSELFDMFSVGGCEIAESAGGPISAAHCPGCEWDDGEWQLAEHKPIAKTRQYREDDGLSAAERSKLVQFHAERITIGAEYTGTNWRKILEL